MWKQDIDNFQLRNEITRQNECGGLGWEARGAGVIINLAVSRAVVTTLIYSDWMPKLGTNFTSVVQIMVFE